MIVCDPTPNDCLRIPHSRFILPAEELPDRFAENNLVYLRNGVLDQYQADEDETADAVTTVLDSFSKASIGLGGTVVEGSHYWCTLQDALKQGVKVQHFRDGWRTVKEKPRKSGELSTAADAPATSAEDMNKVTGEGEVREVTSCEEMSDAANHDLADGQVEMGESASEETDGYSETDAETQLQESMSQVRLAIEGSEGLDLEDDFLEHDVE
ncbi:MAG: hypothetical protein Q9174_004380 [Haloplaca sp. 1 TL-2023]